MYAWFNILPSWDPYSNTEGVAVAAVNKDEGTSAKDNDSIRTMCQINVTNGINKNSQSLSREGFGCFSIIDCNDCIFKYIL